MRRAEEENESKGEIKREGRDICVVFSFNLNHIVCGEFELVSWVGVE